MASLRFPPGERFDESRYRLPPFLGGRSDWLNLLRRTLSFPIPNRFIPAHSIPNPWTLKISRGVQKELLNFCTLSARLTLAWPPSDRQAMVGTARGRWRPRLGCSPSPGSRSEAQTHEVGRDKAQFHHGTAQKRAIGGWVGAPVEDRRGSPSFFHTNRHQSATEDTEITERKPLIGAKDR